MYTETRVMVTSLLLGGLEPTLCPRKWAFFACTEGESSVRHGFGWIFLKIVGVFALLGMPGGLVYTGFPVYKGSFGAGFCT